VSTLGAPLLAAARTIPEPLHGPALMVAATVCFSAMHAGIRYLSADLHPFEIGFFRNMFGLLVVLPWIVRWGLKPLRTGRFRLHAVRALVNVVAMLLFFSGLARLPLAEVQALGFTAPLFATLLAVLILREKVRLRRWSALVVGFAGALIVVRPGIGAIDVGTFYVLGSALIWAGALIIIKSLARTESSVTITLYMSLLMTPLALIPAAFVWVWPSADQLALLVALGISGALGQMLMAQSFRVADASAVLPFDFLKMIWSALFGFLLFAEVPGLATWIGGGVIFGAGSYIAFRESRLSDGRPAATVKSTAPPG